MHGERSGIAESPTVAVSYLMVAAILAGCAQFVTVTRAAQMEGLHGAHEEGVVV